MKYPGYYARQWVTDIGEVDEISGRRACEYVGTRYDNIPGGCSITASYYGTLPDGTEERITVFTQEKIEDPRYFIRRAVIEIEEERGITNKSS